MYTDKKVVFYVTKAKHAALVKLSEHTRVPISALLRDALDQLLKERKG